MTEVQKNIAVVNFTIEEIRKNAPSGATHYFDYDKGFIVYLFKYNYGYRQIKDNIISFYDSGIPLDQIKPL